MCHIKARLLCSLQTDENKHISTDMFIRTIQKSQNPRERKVTLTMNNQKTTFKIDTGVQCNVITSILEYTKKSTANLMAYGGNRLTTCGKATILCQYNGKKYNIEFEVLDCCILGLLNWIWLSISTQSTNRIH